MSNIDSRPFIASINDEDQVSMKDVNGNIRAKATVAQLKTVFSGGGGSSLFEINNNDIRAIDTSKNLLIGSTTMDQTLVPADTTRMFFNKTKYAFRAGQASNDQWDNGNIGNGSAVIGGDDGVSAGDGSAVIGGNINTINSNFSFIGAGDTNEIDAGGDNSSIIGGINNFITGAGIRSSILAGAGNNVSSEDAVIIGGDSQSAEALKCVVVGGSGNIISGSGSNGVIAGGDINLIDSINSGILGGNNNTINTSSDRSVISGGESNSVSDVDSAIISGAFNEIFGGANESFIIGGNSNLVGGSQAGILGGSENEVNSSGAVILGGATNIADEINTVILGGSGNTTIGENSVILGGSGLIGNDFGEILGGFFNTESVGDTASQQPSNTLLKIGNGTNGANRSDALVLKGNGDINWQGSVSHGQLAIFNNILPTIISITNDWVGITTISPTNQSFNTITSNAEFLVIPEDGIYRIDYSVVGNGTENYEFGIGIDDVPANDTTSAVSTIISSSGDSANGSIILSLINTSEVGLYVRNTSGTADIIIRHATLTIQKI